MGGVLGGSPPWVGSPPTEGDRVFLNDYDFWE